MLIDPYRQATDEFFVDTFMLIHVEGGQIYERTGFPAVTVVGSGAVSAAQAKFGAQSFSNPGNSVGTNYVRVEGSATDFVFPGEFTFEGWFYIRALRNAINNIFANNIQFPATGFIQVGIGTAGGHIFLNSTAGVASCAPTDVITPVLNTWAHIAMTRDALDLTRIFVNGDLKSTDAVNGTVGGPNGEGISSFDICRSHAGDNDDLDCFFEEIRVTKHCRYTANFTPPVAPFPPFP
jgi:hypothetical protein